MDLSIFEEHNVELEAETLFENEEYEESSDKTPPDQWPSTICYTTAETLTEKQLQHQRGEYNPPEKEICGRYVLFVDSSEMLHPFRKYPAIVDPGIEAALLEPMPIKEYPEDGQDLYFDMCEELNECFVKLFYEQLLTDTINLRYYSINTTAMYPMSMALMNNRIVKILDLTENFLTRDGWYHLAELIRYNHSIVELNLTACKLDANGTRLLAFYLHKNITLRKLILARNSFGEAGVRHLSNAFFRGSLIKEFDISQNRLTSFSLAILAHGLNYNNQMTHLNLSRNTIDIPKHAQRLFLLLQDNCNLVEINLSMTSMNMRFAKALAGIFHCISLERIDLSNNALTGEVITMIVRRMRHLPQLKYLNLSYNPIKPHEAMLLLGQMRWKKVKVDQLLLDGVNVTQEFMALRIRILRLPRRKNTIITYGYVERKGLQKHEEMPGVDERKLLLRHAEYLCRSPTRKKFKRDFGRLILKLHASLTTPYVPTKPFYRYLKEKGAINITIELVESLTSYFRGPVERGIVTCDIGALVDYIKREFPEKLEPLPPRQKVKSKPKVKNSKAKFKK